MLKINKIGIKVTLREETSSTNTKERTKTTNYNTDFTSDSESEKLSGRVQ